MNIEKEDGWVDVERFAVPKQWPDQRRQTLNFIILVLL
jgi:hypothetical protein